MSNIPSCQFYHHLILAPPESNYQILPFPAIHPSTEYLSLFNLVSVGALHTLTALSDRHSDIHSPTLMAAGHCAKLDLRKTSAYMTGANMLKRRQETTI
jgi:hypothetical protein